MSSTIDQIPDGYEVTFKVDGDEMLISCVGFDPDDAIATARENIAEAGYTDDYPVLSVRKVA